MSGQKKISSFFTTVLTNRNQNIKMKRPAGDREVSTSESTPSKKLRTEIECTTTLKQTSPIFRSLSPNARAMGLDLMGASWAKALGVELEKDYFKKLTNFVVAERKSHTIYPPVADVFSWTTQCSIKQVKVVILGQDPYHGPNQAHGLCFSVKRPVPPPPSLENMFKELSSDIDGFSHPGHGDLTGWAKQGVLLLNAVLTVRAHSANSHKDKGWEKFTDAVIKHINSHNAGVVFMLWGSYAQKKGAFIDKKRHHILKCVHPSPLSAYRGFFGCKHFSQANKLLKAQGDPEIDWCDL